MTHDDHQRERMRVWAHAFLASTALCAPHQNADMALAEFDKRFPAPSVAVTYDPVTGIFDGTRAAATPVEPDQSAMGMAVSSLILDQTAELATLRQKARLFDKLCEELPPGWKQHLRCWDAVASGKLGIYPRDGDFAVHWDIGHSIRPTAAEAVERAIAQGALK